MVSINNLGDTLAVRLTRNNDFNNLSESETLSPPITGALFFRVLSNHVVELYVSFAYSSAVMDATGNLTETRTVIAGYEDIWYRCSSGSIDKPTIYLVSPPAAFATFDSIDLVFQFANTVPTDYIFSL